jgi:hypothetical protein
MHTHLFPGDIETAYAAYLEGIQDGHGVADGCDEAMLTSRHWATPHNNDWRLTDEGRRHLQQWGGSA